MSAPTDKTAVILLVEDDPADQELARRAFRRAQLAVDLRVVEDGQAALDYLSGVSRCVGSRPALILLDLNMPRMGGMGVLERVSEDEDLRTIPIVVLTTSDEPSEQRDCYSLGARSFLTKPSGLDRLTEMVKGLEKYWYCPESLSA